jgi:hypothetical protein
VDKQSEIHAVSTSEAEKFWTEGQDATQSSTGVNEPETSTLDDQLRASLALIDSEGIDMPGVGVVRPAGVSPVELRSRRESAGDEVPQMERDPVAGAKVENRRRERLISQLIFAARDLAQEQIEPTDGTEPAFCTECIADEVNGAIAHERLCRTGRVLVVIDGLIGTLVSKPDQKEAVTDEEAHAGDGTRPRGHGTKEHFEALVKDLGELVCKAHPDSALSGLETTAAAFGCLLDVYAAPNPENPAGMCDDKVAFREHFAQILTEGGAR